MPQEDQWLVGLPIEVSVEKSLAEVTDVVKRFPRHRVDNFCIPRLKVGTLDDLMLATDKLQSLYEKTERLLTKLIHLTGKVLNRKRSDVAEALNINGKPLVKYLTNFKWEISKYSMHLKIDDISNLIDKQGIQMSADMLKISREYFEVDDEVCVLERLQNCSLLYRDVSFFVKEEDFVLDSKYLTTALVVVHRARYNEWTNCYERIDREVVPRSSRLLLEDEDYGLFTVTLFKRHLQLFVKRAKELHFLVKDFHYEREVIESKRSHLFAVRSRRKKLHISFVKWLTAQFGETYIALVHLQAIRMEVECDLRYGPETNFFTAIITVASDDSVKLLEALRKHYQRIDDSLKYICDRYRLNETDDFPFVYLPIPADIELFK